MPSQIGDSVGEIRRSRIHDHLSHPSIGMGIDLSPVDQHHLAAGCGFGEGIDQRRAHLSGAAGEQNTKSHEASPPDWLDKSLPPEACNTC
jgi:hypothetical protein